MPISRYEGRTKAANTNEMYKDYFDRKGQKFFKQYVTGMLSYPTEKQIESLDLVYHTWGMGDRYEKLASEHYGDSRLWFIIAWFNKKPLEQMAKPGSVIYIPKPMERVMDYMDI